MPGNKVAPRFLPIIVILALATFSRVEAQLTTDSASRMSGADYRSGLEQETFSLVNRYRKTHELSLLAWDDSIAKVARAHSKDMATGEVDFGHEGFSDRIDYLKTVMTGLWGAGENVLMTSEPDQVAQRAVALWVRSPHHLENIRGDYNYSGLGVWQDKNGAIYFTQIFVKIRTLAEETQTDPMPSVITPFGMLTTPNTRARP